MCLVNCSKVILLKLEANGIIALEIEDHFVDFTDMIEIGKGARGQAGEVRLSRYACYLVVQNGDPTKPVIVNGQTYFAIQTRRQELADNKAFQQLKEDEKRLLLRKEL